MNEFTKLAERFRGNAERCERHAAECDAEEKSLGQKPDTFSACWIVWYGTQTARIRRRAHDARTMAKVWREAEKDALDAAQRFEPAGSGEGAKFV